MNQINRGRLHFLFAIVFGLITKPLLPAQDRSQREAEKNGWILDFDNGMRQAQKSGKPVMVVLRCAPCVDCRDLDTQVVRLNGIKDLADQFVRVRLNRIDTIDLSLFDFDYDLTFVVFFLDAQKRIYSRYGGRDSENADGRMSLDALHHTMESVLTSIKKGDKAFAPQKEQTPRFLKDLSVESSRGCVHCHQVRQDQNLQLLKAGKWNREKVFRYPLPENIGIVLEVARNNILSEVKAKTPAGEAGLKKGDVVRLLNGVPIHSFADFQYALDVAPGSGKIPIAWQRNEKEQRAELTLLGSWRKTDVSWRPSMRDMIPSVRLGGSDLKASERKALGLSEKQLAFWEKEPLFKQALDAGIRAGDIILGLNNREFEMTMTEFQDYVRSNYLVGDIVTINLLRKGARENVSMTLGKK